MHSMITLCIFSDYLLLPIYISILDFMYYISYHIIFHILIKIEFHMHEFFTISDIHYNLRKSNLIYLFLKTVGKGFLFSLLVMKMEGYYKSHTFFILFTVDDTFFTVMIF